MAQEGAPPTSSPSGQWCPKRRLLLPCPAQFSQVHSFALSLGAVATPLCLWVVSAGRLLGRPSGQAKLRPGPASPAPAPVSSWASGELGRRPPCPSLWLTIARPVMVNQ